MKRHLPGRIELALFFCMAAVSMVVFGLSVHHDTALFVCTAPIVFISLLLGFRRSQIVSDAADSSDEREPLL